MKFFALIFMLLSTCSAFAQSFDPLESKDLRTILTKMSGAALLESDTLTSIAHECYTREIVLNGVDPVSRKRQRVRLKRFIPYENKFKAGLFMIPPTSPPRGNATILDLSYAKQFCSDGVNVTILNDWDGYTEPGIYDFGTHDRATIRAVHAAQMALKYLQTPVFVFGTSVGAIYSSFLLGMSDQVQGGVMIVGGAPLSEVLKTTDQEIPKTLRELRMEHFQIQDLDAYEKLILKNVRLSPENFIAPEKSKDIMMVVATEDSTVPTATQEKLWNAWGQPARIDHDSNHVPTVVKSFLFDKKVIEDFLLSRFREFNLSGEPLAEMGVISTPSARAFRARLLDAAEHLSVLTK